MEIVFCRRNLKQDKLWQWNGNNIELSRENKKFPTLIAEFSFLFYVYLNKIRCTKWVGISVNTKHYLVCYLRTLSTSEII